MPPELKHNLGDLVHYAYHRDRPYSGFDDPNLGMIVKIETDLYTRYKVKWVNREGFNYFQSDEIRELKNNFKRESNARTKA